MDDMSEFQGAQPYGPQADLGTPAPIAIEAPVRLEVDGRTVEVAAGTSVMRAAELAGIKVPKLCATDTLDAFGSNSGCRHAEIRPVFRRPLILRRRLPNGK